MNEADGTRGEPAAAANRPMSSRPSVAFVAFVLAFLVTVAWAQQGARQDASEARRGDLAELVAVRQARAAARQADLRSLREQLDALTAASPDRRLETLTARLERLRLATGLAAVEGPGLSVELADSALAKRGDPGAIDFLIQDVDLQSVVNALWRSGAEAVSINDQRIITTTAIRSAGGAVLVNFEVLTSPYTVRAVGDAAAMRAAFEASAITERFKRWTEVYGLGFSISEEDEMTLPAYDGSIRLRYAAAADGNDK